MTPFSRNRWGAMFLAAVLAGLVPADLAGAERGWREFAGVSSGAYREANGDRAIQLSVEVPASSSAVFDALTTAAGFTSWAVPFARIDLRIGGSIESSYDAAAQPGDRANIRNEIVAYVPPRLLVLRNVQAPPDFTDPDLFQRTVTVIELAPLDAAHTRVTLTNAGYGSGPRFDALYQRFEWADAYSLAELARRFVSGPVDWAERAHRQQATSAAQTVNHGQ